MIRPTAVPRIRFTTMRAAPWATTGIALAWSCVFAACGGHPAATASPDAVQEPPSIPQPLPVSMEREVTDRVAIETNMGTMVVALYGKDAPNTVRNFLAYVDSGFYEGKVFHRVIPGFMIQGGGFDEKLARAETGAPLPLEIIPGLKHEAGVISMARTNDPDSATSQFFICVAAAVQLNGLYAAFGEIEEGIDVALEISSVPTQTVTNEQGEMGDVPTTPVIIQRVQRLDKAAEAPAPKPEAP